MGINHHLKNVLFGCAFLLDEMIPSLLWLFETFLESIENKAPKIIFTNQCQVMARAIEQVVPNTYHGLWLWYISESAAQQMASNYSDPIFRKLLNRCLL